MTLRRAASEDQGRSGDGETNDGQVEVDGGGAAALSRGGARAGVGLWAGGVSGVRHELIRLLMEQTAESQAEQVPEAALASAGGERAMLTGTEPRTLASQSGAVSWEEPKAYLPKSRKAFFPMARLRARNEVRGWSSSLGATAGLPSSVGGCTKNALLDKPAVAPRRRGAVPGNRRCWA